MLTLNLNFNIQSDKVNLGPVKSGNMPEIDFGEIQQFNTFERSDWNANEGEPGHILNRPFCTEIVDGIVLAETTLDFSNSIGDYRYPEIINITTGEQYNVKWNGVEYPCTAVFYENRGIVLGNEYSVGGESNGYPFTFIVYDDRTHITDHLRKSTNTFSILGPSEIVHKIPEKYLPDNIGGGAQSDWNANEGEPGHILNRTHWVEEGSIVEILPETNLTFEDGQAIAIPVGEMVVGETYTIEYNGTEYECTTLLGEGYMFGNFGLMGMEDTGEPFLGIYAPAGMLTETAIVMFLTVDGATEATVSIYQKQRKYNKLDAKYLPDGVPTNVLLVNYLGNAASVTGADIYTQCVLGGKIAFMYFAGATLTLQEVTEEGRAKFGNMYYDMDENMFCFRYAVVEADGSISDFGNAQFTR